MNPGGRYLPFFPILILLLLLPISCKSEERIELQLGSELFSLEVADEPEERQRGLMFRDSLGDQEGMIFIFQRDQLLSFWMKNTRIPLSIAYITKGGEVVDILPLIPKDKTPVPSSRSVRYAIEVNRGAFQRSGLQVGDRIDLGPIASYVK
jgi:uncharacterized protein